MSHKTEDNSVFLSGLMVLAAALQGRLFDFHVESLELGFLLLVPFGS